MSINRAGVVIAVFAAQGLVFAADEVISGNLSVAGDTDLGGNTLSFGTRSDSATTPGLNLLYSDETVPTVFFNATRSNVAWLWQSNTGSPQVKIEENNRLLIYDQSATPVARITLDPSGTSLFWGSLLVNGNDNRLPNQALATGDSILTKALADGRYVLDPGFSGGGVSFRGSSAYGDLSTAMSLGYAVGRGATAMSGGYTGAKFSTAMSGGYASAEYSTAMSSGSAIGGYSTAMSSGSAVAEYSTAMSGGYAGTEYSTAMSGGYVQSYGAGGHSTAMSGGGVEGAYSVSMSDSYVYSNYSNAMSGGIANGDYSTAIGPGTYTSVTGQVVVGRYNAPAEYGDELFIVGNGEIDQYVQLFRPGLSYSNAFVVRGNGNIWVAGDSLFVGNVGIGTTTPSVKLDVVGEIKTTGRITSKTAIRIPASGDLSMGIFTAHGGLGNPAQ